MTTFKVLIIACALLFAGCDRASSERPVAQSQTDTKYADSEAAIPKTEAESTKTTAAGIARSENQMAQARSRNPMQEVSLSQADNAHAAAQSFDRKIIRNAELSLEVSEPTAAQHRIASIAESLGGFVITSETKQNDATSHRAPNVETSLVVRIPSSQFGAALDQIRALGSRVIQEKVSGNDVTEEFIDLEARIKTQKALETQFLEIMKRASKVSDALEVQTEIASVRGEIERLEGRKRFLESRTTLSTINATLRIPTPIVASTSGFGREVKDAVRDGVSIAGAIVLFFIRFVILIVPVLILLVLPSALIARVVVRRSKRLRESADSAAA